MWRRRLCEAADQYRYILGAPLSDIDCRPAIDSGIMNQMAEQQEPSLCVPHVKQIAPTFF